MSFVITRGGAADIDGVGALHALSRMKTYKFISGYEPERYTAHWRTRFEAEHEHHRLRVAKAVGSGELVGFAYAGNGFLHAIHVHPDWKGLGVGQALMAAARISLRELGFARAALWVLDDNGRACRFYERDGWVLSGQTRMSEMDGALTRQLEYVRDLHADSGVALAFIRDSRGFVLLQHRDEHSRVGPNKWGMPGGLIEPGESALEAVHREVFEETGLVVPNLRPFWSGLYPAAGPDVPAPVMIHAFHGTTTAPLDDVVLGEGKAMVFVDPGDIPALDTLPWVTSLLEVLEHHVKADVAEGGVVEGLGHGGEDVETQ